MNLYSICSGQQTGRTGYFKRKHGRAKMLMWMFLVLCLTLPVKTQAAERAVTDQAGILTEEEIQELTRQAEELEQDTGWDVMVVTTADTGGMDTLAYMEAWFDEHREKDDGVISAIDMDNQILAVWAFGGARSCIGKEEKNKIMDAGLQEVKTGIYGPALKVMLNEIREVYESEYPEDTEEAADDQEERRRITDTELLIAAVAALAAGGITAGNIIVKYRLRFGGYRYPVEKNGNLNLRIQEDRLVNQFVKKRDISK